NVQLSHSSSSSLDLCAVTARIYRNCLRSPKLGVARSNRARVTILGLRPVGVDRRGAAPPRAAVTAGDQSACNSQFANSELCSTLAPMALRPQDVVVLLKLVVADSSGLTYAAIAESLGMSLSEVHGSLDRALESGLARKEGRAPARPIPAALKEFLVHGLRYAFPARVGGPARGIPTAHAAPPLKTQLAPSDEPPPVWPDPKGTVRGMELAPLYRSVPGAAKRDAKLYELLALADALRIGRARERKLAEAELGIRLG